MSRQSAASSHGPRNLDQLINGINYEASADGDDAEHELPLLIPLSHGHPLLSSETETFNVDAFLLSRPNTSLSDLRGEMRDYLAQLKEELVQLINDDYAAFISLRTDLRGEGPRLEHLQGPLELVKQEIDESRWGLLNLQSAIQEKLAERAELREEKTLLHLLLKVSDLVVRLENMLLIPSPDESTSQIEHSPIGVRDMNGMITSDTFHPSGEEDPDEQRPAINRVKHLSRIAVEYSQLLYHAEKVRKQQCVFVHQLQKRIDKINTTLARDLDVVFSTALLSVTNPTSADPQSTAARARAISEFSECLLIYETLERWDAAEEVIRQDVVVPFVKKTIHPGALSTPLSPVVPRTPLLDVSLSSSANQKELPSPNTPFTPYPNALQTRFHSNLSSSFLNQPINLIESPGNPDDPLVHLLNTILRFVERDCRLIIDLAERANSLRSYKRNKGRIPGGARERDGEDIDLPKESFDIMGGVIWAEIGKSLMENLGSTLFAAGRPDEFQKNYAILHEFITMLEYATPSLEAVSALRSNSVYDTFERRWQLPVYFQLRWKEIVGELEDSLIRPSPDLASKKGDGFFVPQARGIYQAIAICWSSNVYIPELGHRFWKLTLQILGRYKTWLESTLPVRRVPPSSASAKPEAQDTSEIDDAHIRVYACALADIRNLQRRTKMLFSDIIVTLLPTESILSEDAPAAETVLMQTLDQLDSLVPSLASQIVAILTSRCCEPLQHVRSIPSQYRAMSARKGSEMPTECSYFVPNVLRPLREFLFDADGPGAVLQKEFGSPWAAEVFKEIAIKYTGYLAGMKKTEDSLRRYNKSKRSTFMLFGANNTGGTAAGDREGRDELRIRAQMVLDVETLGKNAKSLGNVINVDGSEEYKELIALAAHKDAEG